MPHREAIREIIFSPDGQVIIASSGLLGESYFLWEADTGKLLGPPIPIPYGTVINPDGRVFRPIDLWGAVAGKPMARILPHPFQVTAVGFSPDGATLLTAMDYGSIGWNPAIARFWDVRTGLPVGPAMVMNYPIRAAVFSPDGRLVCICDRHGTARVWEAATGKLVSPFLNSGHAVHGNSTLIAFSLDSKTVAISGSPVNNTRAVHLWNARTGEPMCQFPSLEGGVSALAFSPDSSMLLTGGSDRQARPWDVRTGKPLGEPFPHKDRILSVAFSPDGRSIATACWDRTAQVWDVTTRQPIGPPLVHEGGLTRVVFSPNGKVVLTGSEDHTARLWSAATGQAIGMPLRHQAPVRLLAFNPEGTLF